MKLNPFIVSSFIFFAFILMSCSNPKAIEIEPDSQEKYPINLAHFNHLYKEINLNGDTLGIVHIYSEYPTYEYTIEPAEGFTCVDDVARAAVMLSEYYTNVEARKDVLHQIKMLVNFILFMQNENGYFNNFMWNDYSINTTYKTTVAELNWWSMRALWALETALPLLESNSTLSTKIKSSSAEVVANFKRDLGSLDQHIDTINTMALPSWLPRQYAADQAAILILGLLPYHSRTADTEVQLLVDRMAEGIILMQPGDPVHFPHGAFLSWQNLWHAWGNSQAYALLKAGQQFNNEDYITSALKEVDNFYPYMLKNGFAEAFWVEYVDDELSEIKRNEYPRIAYGIRPMVWAAEEAYQLTKRTAYWDLSKELAWWFHGNNVAHMNMYNDTTGRCFDGILSNETINKNSGSESTLECLMTLIKLN